MIKAILFDLDGTLLNREESVKHFVEHQYDRLLSENSQVLKKEYVNRFIELDSRGYVWKDKVYEQMVEEFAICGMTWEALLNDYIEQFKYSCIPFPHLISMLEELRRYNLSLGIISNGYGQFQMDNIKALNIESYFDAILLSEWEGIKKPNAEIFQRGLHQLKVSPHECVFVGDHPENDVKAAQNVGMMAVWKRDSYWNQVNSDFVIDRLASLPAIIKNINELEVENL